MDYSDRHTAMFCDCMKNEKPVFIENDRIGFYRYMKYTGIGKGIGNTVPNYELYLKHGFEEIYNYLKIKENETEGENRKFASNAARALDAAFDYCDRLQKEANGELAEMLKVISRKKPETYHQALVMVKFIIYTLRCDNIDHVTLGRFDKYMTPFYESDIKRGMSREEILELTEEFFLSINFDTDLYTGVQQGDNGQSLMLGGYYQDGTDSFNELSKICMEASMELNLIDPKINLRVNKNTPLSMYILGTQMTKIGLGFPQYSNDDIVIPGLIELGYAPEDAYNYSVAACWEYIVPDAFDIPNICTMNYPKVVNDTIYKSLKKSKSFNEFLTLVKENIMAECDALLMGVENMMLYQDPYYSLSLSTCIQQCKDYTAGAAKYINFGFHGAGLANAADALAAVKKLYLRNNL